MKVNSNLSGRLRNTSLPAGHGLLPVFEAVVNSIHAIEDNNNLNKNGEIIVEIKRLAQKSFELKSKNLEPIIGFEIIDNGIGFNQENFDSFQVLDSDFKVKKGGRGIGRLMWLKAFNRVEVNSVFINENGKFINRSFKFNHDKWVHDEKCTESQLDVTSSKISLVEFHERYRKAVPSRVESIAKQLLEHCLWYFIRPEYVPRIILKDGDDLVDLSALYDEYMHADAVSEKVSINDETFELTHIKFRTTAGKRHHIALCAANRLVKEESIQGNIPGLYEKVDDEKGRFTYTCYVSSEYLDEHVRPERTAFDIEEKNNTDIFGNTEISIQEIKDAVLQRTKTYLKSTIDNNLLEGKKRIDDFIDKKAPKFRPMMNYMSEDARIIDPSKSDKEVELFLHSHFYDLEYQLLAEGQTILQPVVEERIEEYQIRVQDYLKKVCDLHKSDLASYVSHRKVILELFEKSLQALHNGKYEHESVLHNLIMPMGKDSSEIQSDSCNLWLVDERLAFHHYLASDKKLMSMPITDSNSEKEPDILGLQLFDTPFLVNNKTLPPYASLTIIEIKRPMRNDMKDGVEKNPIDQCLDYLSRAREGKVKTIQGRPVMATEDIPGYCYVLCDLSDNMIKQCKLAGLQMTPDGMGYFGYNNNFKAYIEVMSFDLLLCAAKERNSAFFDKLGFPID